MRSAILFTGAAFLLVLLPGCGAPHDEPFAEETRRLESFTHDYRARAYYERRDAALAAVLQRLAAAARTANPPEELEAHPDLKLARFLYPLLRPELRIEGLPEAPDPRDLVRALDAAKLKPPAVLHLLLGVGLLFNGQDSSAIYEFATEGAGPSPASAWLVSLCRAYLDSELKLPLHAAAALAEAEKLQSDSLSDEYKHCYAMFSAAIAMGASDWPAARRALQDLQGAAPQSPLAQLLSLTLAIHDGEQEREDKKRPREPFQPGLYQVQLGDLKDPWLAERATLHLEEAFASQALAALARDREMWLRAITLSLLGYAADKPALDPVRDWITCGQLLADKLAAPAPSKVKNKSEDHQ